MSALRNSKVSLPTSDAGHMFIGGGLMQYLDGAHPPRQPCARELQFIVQLYQLPIGAHLERDGTWVVR